MPKKIETWECGICGQVYKEEAHAIECEAMHAQPLKFVQCKFNKLNIYPAYIEIEFSNGEIRRYNRAAEKKSKGRRY